MAKKKTAKKVASRVKPDFTITGLKDEYKQWVIAMAAAQNRTPENYIEMLIRTDYLQNRRTNGQTGKRSDFNPAVGDWS